MSLGMFLFAENDAAIVTDRTSMETRKLTTQVVRFQSRIVDVLRHPTQRGFDSGAHVRIFPDNAAK